MNNQLLKHVRIKDRFWRTRMDVIRDVVIPYQWDALNDRIQDAAPSHAIENFRIAAGEATGEFHGAVFQDSDVAKWLEAVAYSLMTDPNPELESLADEVIALIGRAQQADGYLNTYYTVKEPGRRFTNLRDNHELYCAGHMIEAAVAYYYATGKQRFLDIVCRFADYIDSVFGPGEHQIRGYDGHQEIELALIKLYQATNEEKYLRLSQFFIDERGKQPHFFEREAAKRGYDSLAPWVDPHYQYHQAHLPVREQDKAVGHAVRAMYMYTAMAQLASLTKDQSIAEACRKLWDNVTQRQMYITGGIGSQECGESFTFDFDLPNDTSYTETCASIGLVFWAHSMLQLEKDRKYSDVMERALYNGTISGMDLEGKKFFYVNPLEVWPQSCENRKDKQHVKTVRQKWFSCACCPPNLARLTASMGQYVYSAEDEGVYVHLYISSEAEMEVRGQKVRISQTSEYPWEGDITLTVTPEQEANFTVALRIPGWCWQPRLMVNDQTVDLDAFMEKGYVHLERHWSKGDRIHLSLPMEVELIQSHPSVRENSGKLAIQRGPIVYCLEEVDNGSNLQALTVSIDTTFDIQFEDDLLGGVAVITGMAERLDMADWGDELYKPASRRMVPARLKAVPYHLWGNREPGEMVVWIREKHS